MTGPERRKLVLTEEEFAVPDAPAAPAPPSHRPPLPQHTHAAPPPAQPAQEFPTVGGVGAPRRVVAPGSGAPAAPATLPAWLNVNTVIGRSIVAAAAGIALGWALTEILGLPEWSATSKAQLNVHAAVFVGLLGVSFAIVYAGWEYILARSPEGLLHVLRTSAPIAVGLGLVSGFLAQVVYSATLESIDPLCGGICADQADIRAYLARGLAWGLFGMGMGASSAVLIRSRQKLINGLVGGAVGGAVGGIIFQWMVLNVHSQVFGRLVGLMFVGVGIGVAIGLIETARRDAWLNVIGGAMTGKEFIVYEAETKIGSDPKCEIVLIKDPEIQPYHFVINTPAGSAQQSRTLVAYEGCAVTIQGQPVARHTLRDGDVIGVGTTFIKYAERITQQPVASGI